MQQRISQLVYVIATRFQRLGKYSVFQQHDLTSEISARQRKCGVAIGIPLVSWLQAEIDVMVYALPVFGGHLRFTSHPDIEAYSHQSHRVAGPRKVGVAFGIPLLSCIQAEIYVMVYALPVFGGHL